MGTATKVALVTTDDEHLHGGDEDLCPLVEALDHRGIGADCRIWHDRTVAWGEYQMVILRSTWDYTFRGEEFGRWLDHVSATVTVVNCAHTVRWNMDKSYLLDLSARGVPVIPTEMVSDTQGFSDAVARIDSPTIVVKPVVSAGARNTGMFDRADPAAEALAREILAGGRRALVQPAVASVAEIGEKALIYFDGKFSHAAAKGPILAMGGHLVGGSYRETIGPYTPTEEEVSVADTCLVAATDLIVRSGCDCPTAVPLYGRIDLVETVSGPLVLEAELFEPSLFVNAAPGAPARFAAAAAARLD